LFRSLIGAQEQAARLRAQPAKSVRTETRSQFLELTATTAPEGQGDPLQLGGFRPPVGVGVAVEAVRKDIGEVVPLAAEDGVVAHAVNAHAESPQLDDRV